MTRSIGAGAVEVFVDAHAEVGESPLWDAGSQELLWVDIPQGRVHRSDVSSGQSRSVNVGQPVGAVALRAGGGLIGALRDGFAFIEPGTGAVELVASVERGVHANRMNDGKCDRVGRFWAGTMAEDMRPGAGSLYRLDPDLRTVQILDDVSVSNGLAWDSDDSTMYFIDSGTGGIDAFDYDAETGAISNRRRIVDVEPELGLPDGMTIDSEDCIWVAVWGGWQVRRYTPEGSLDTVVELPAAQVTSCTFGGQDLDLLFVTSAATGVGDGERRKQPHAGAVFRVDPGVTGVAPSPFLG